MIIKITVKDNDFRSLMMKFIKIMFDPIYEDCESDNVKVAEHLKSAKIFSYTKSDSEVVLTPQIKEEIKTYITEQFVKYLEVKCDKTFADTKQYLMDNFEVSIHNYLMDYNENGECFYWLQHSNTIINQ